jgi:cytochrome c oxidase subunit 2
MDFITLAFLDYSFSAQLGFQDAATAIMQGIINLHHHIFFFIIMILIFVFWVFYRTFKISYWLNTPSFFIWYFFDKKKNFLSWKKKFFYQNFIKKIKLYYNFNINHGTFIEIIWTILPSLVLLFIVGPSFALLYAMDAASDPDFSVKIIGHQWYWTYEYTDTYLTHGKNLINSYIDTSLVVNEVAEYIFDSYMKSTNDLVFGELRLLEVDNALYLPVFSKIRLDITSDDVLHAFAVPSLGIKVDAVPGRLNVAYVDILREGIFFGQCSELCGVNHGYMPIKIIVIDSSDFIMKIFFGSCENLKIIYSSANLLDLYYSVINESFIKKIQCLLSY